MTPHTRWTRRAVMAAALGAGVARASALAPPSARVVSLDWGWTAVLIGLGVRPVGLAEQRLYRDWVVTPALPDGVPDVGLRTAPSLETLAALKPDLILTNALNETIRPRLERIAPTLPNPTYTGGMPLADAKAAVRHLGQRLGRVGAADTLVDEAEHRIDAVRGHLDAWRGRALLPLTIIDPRHVTIYGDGSLFADVLRAVGLRDLWTAPTGPWGSTVQQVAALADLPPGDLLVVGPTPPVAAAHFDRPGLFTALCAAAGRRVYHTPSAWGFGDVSAAARFAGLLGDALVGTLPA